MTKRASQWALIRVVHEAIAKAVFRVVIGVVALVLVLLPSGACADDLQRADDVAMAAIFSFREATQVHLLAHALGMAALNGTPSEEVAQKCEQAIDSYENVSLPILRKYLAKVEHDAAMRELFSQIQVLQQRALAEVQAIKAMAESGNARAEKLAFVEANRAYTEIAKAVVSAVVKVPAGGTDESSQPPPGATGKARRPDAEFPISWRQFQQITGPEGGDTRYIRNGDGELQRIECRMRGDLLVAVTEEAEGFRLTIGNELAIADIASRGLFTEAESDALIEVFSELQTDGERNRPQRKVGRFQFIGERDPQFQIKPSVVITLAE